MKVDFEDFTPEQRERFIDEWYALGLYTRDVMLGMGDIAYCCPWNSEGICDLDIEPADLEPGNIVCCVRAYYKTILPAIVDWMLEDLRALAAIKINPNKLEYDLGAAEALVVDCERYHYPEGKKLLEEALRPFRR